jgi:hypothetical protein
MEFGWGFIALFFVIFWGCGRLCGWGRRHKKKHGAVEQMRSEDDRRLASLESRVKGRLGRSARERPVIDALYDGDSQREPVHARGKRASPLEDLQKQFIEGRISLEEYEKELDRLEKLE